MKFSVKDERVTGIHRNGQDLRRYIEQLATSYSTHFLLLWKLDQTVLYVLIRRRFMFIHPVCVSARHDVHTAKKMKRALLGVPDIHHPFSTFVLSIAIQKAYVQK